MAGKRVEKRIGTLKRLEYFLNKRVKSKTTYSCWEEWYAAQIIDHGDRAMAKGVFEKQVPTKQHITQEKQIDPEMKEYLRLLLELKKKELGYEDRSHLKVEAKAEVLDEDGGIESVAECGEPCGEDLAEPAESVGDYSSGSEAERGEGDEGSGEGVEGNPAEAGQDSPSQRDDGGVVF